MTDMQVSQSYSARAAEYTSILGSIDDMHPLDKTRIERWSEQITGSALDAGCGPGHWTDHLHKRGIEISGIDLVPEFIESARNRFPEVPFRVASLRALDVADSSLGGVLAWYSLIHLAPAELPQILAELARALKSNGHLLIGFFDGASAEPLNHVVTTAYHWSVDEMSRLLHDAGFDVLEIETRQDPGSRPHAAVSAIAR
ncbi:class I SAM-dependent methyltransferase [Arthrobacter alpinus]|uniref:class I SAM-dependent methyltransferase n=1 Tax=Arthrobacter alpinus TaxID=656366 RepID=UPI001C989BFD|nr:class I SAM-dependent methyltransferase [Arthrobacter alpinus]